MRKIARALISVSDKTGVADFAAGLAALGVEILSTGGTARLLRDKGLKIRDVSQLTGYPEMLDGRVKTLHPKVHGGILAIRSNAQHQAQVAEQGIEYIDLVAVSLYPFEKTAEKAGVSLEELIENIDIDGHTMIRSAAKNFEDVTVIVDGADYSVVLGEMQSNGGVSRETRARLSRKAFATTAAYDSAISTTLQKRAGAEFPESLHLNFKKVMDLRYGENPHQKAALYAARAGGGLAGARQHQGKELSYNNLVDLEAAWRMVHEFDQPTTAIIKHTNQCGIASAATLAESFTRALGVDPVSVYGWVIAFNRPLAVEVAAREPEAAARRPWLTFAIVGGGPTGVEYAGALSELVRLVLARDFPELDMRQVRIVLIESWSIASMVMLAPSTRVVGLGAASHLSQFVTGFSTWPPNSCRMADSSLS